jgi:hypothetical protein
LLEEFRAFRTELESWKQDAGERVATLEAKVTDLHGNGQPGRMTKAEKKLSLHDKIIWTASGVLLTVQTWLGIPSGFHFWPWHK